MKKKMIVAATAIVLLAGCKEEAKNVSEKDVTLDTVEKKMSYIVGYNTSQQAKSNGLTLDRDVIMAALGDVAEGAESRMSEDEMRATLKAFQAALQTKEQEDLNKMIEKNAAAGKAFLEENAKKDGVKQTESGLQYEIVQAGEGASPKAEDMVLVHYVGKHLDGTEFDASAKHGGPVKFPVNGLIPGWVEALQLMNKGAKWKLFIPGDLAYGAGGKMDMRTRQYDIEPNELLIFELELIDINPKEDKEEVAAEAKEETEAK